MAGHLAWLAVLFKIGIEIICTFLVEKKNPDYYLPSTCLNIFACAIFLYLI